MVDGWDTTPYQGDVQQTSEKYIDQDWRPMVEHLPSMPTAQVSAPCPSSCPECAGLTRTKPSRARFCEVPRGIWFV